VAKLGGKVWPGLASQGIFPRLPKKFPKGWLKAPLGSSFFWGKPNYPDWLKLAGFPKLGQNWLGPPNKVTQKIKVKVGEAIYQKFLVLGLLQGPFG